MKNISGAQAFIESLRSEGVKHVFGFPGGAVLDPALNGISIKMNYISPGISLFLCMNRSDHTGKKDQEKVTRGMFSHAFCLNIAK